MINFPIQIKIKRNDHHRNKMLSRIAFLVLLGISILNPLQAKTTAEYDISSVAPGDGIKAISANFVGVPEPYHYDSQNSKRFGRWKINDTYNIQAKYSCSIRHQYGFWSTLDECWGNFYIYYDRDKILARQAAELETLRSKETDALQLFAKRIVLQSSHNLELSKLDDERNQLNRAIAQSQNIFSNVVNNGHYFSINGVNYFLENLQMYSGGAVADVLGETTVMIEKERRDFFMIAALVTLGLAILIYAIRKLALYVRSNLKEGREKVKKLKVAAFTKVDELQAAHQRRKIRAVMMDETIREMTRTAVSEADTKSKEVLLAELRKAVENGNHELANALESALKRS